MATTSTPETAGALYRGLIDEPRGNHTSYLLLAAGRKWAYLLDVGYCERYRTPVDDFRARVAAGHLCEVPMRPAQRKRVAAICRRRMREGVGSRSAAKQAISLLA